MHLGVTGHPNGLSLVGQLGPSAAAEATLSGHPQGQQACTRTQPWGGLGLQHGGLEGGSGDRPDALCA